MTRERDLFANFERMRREMDELFGDVWQRAGYVPHGRPGFKPKVDIYYCGDDSRIVVVEADLAGIDVSNVNLVVQGRELTISGKRRSHAAESRAYQQIEIEGGHFERTIDLGMDVVEQDARASYEDGILRVELPVVGDGPEHHTVKVNEGDISGEA